MQTLDDIRAQAKCGDLKANPTGPSLPHDTAKAQPPQKSADPSKPQTLQDIRRHLSGGKGGVPGKVHPPIKPPSEKVAKVTDQALQSFFARGGLRSVYNAGALGMDQ